jgi:hypothetical protein
MKRMTKIRFILLTLAAATAMASVVPAASGSPVRAHSSKASHAKKMSRGTSEPADPGPPGLGSITVTVVDIPVPPDLANQSTAIPTPTASPTQPSSDETSSQSSSSSTPQVVTGPAPTTPATVTTSTTATNPAPTTPATVMAPASKPAPPPYCSNHPEFGQGPPPHGWVKDPTGGTCSYDVCLNIDGVQSVPPNDAWNEPMIQDAKGNCAPKYRPASINLCTKDHRYEQVPVDQMADALVMGDTPAIMVEGFGPMCLLTDIEASQGNPSDFVPTNVYVGGDPSYFPRFACAHPFGADMPAPLYQFFARKGETFAPTAKEEPGCPAAKPAATQQTLLSVKQHGLLWGGHYFRDTQVFARVLAREGGTWRGWKKYHPALARGLMAHDKVSRQRK